MSYYDEYENLINRGKREPPWWVWLLGLIALCLISVGMSGKDAKADILVLDSGGNCIMLADQATYDVSGRVLVLDESAPLHPAPPDRIFYSGMEDC